MLREHNYILRQVNIAADFCLAIAAFLAAHYGRHLVSIYLAPQYIGPAPLEYHIWVLPFMPVLTIVVLGYNGFYKSQRLRTRIKDLIRLVAISSVEITALMMAAIFVSRFGPQVSRPLILLSGVLLFVFLSVKTYAMRRFLMYLRRRGFNFRRVVLVGSGPPLSRFIDLLEGHPIWGLKVEGIITDRQGEFDASLPEEERAILGHPLIGDLDTAFEALDKCQVDEVVMLPQEVTFERLAPLMEMCEIRGIRTHLPLHFFDNHIARPIIDHFDEIAVVSYWPTREIGPALLCKYAIDRVLGLLLMVILSPVLIASMIAIKLRSKKGDPVFYIQMRVGLNSRPFKLWKFRTMTIDAEQRQAELDPLNEVDGPVFKMRNDPRITPVGRLLRRFSIDELPQLWNVIRGDMSLVGPRPPMPHEIKKYDRWQRRRLSMKPGITCIWQVEGRHRVSFDSWMKLDLQYIDNWSLLLDFKILMRTIFAVIMGQGAM